MSISRSCDLLRPARRRRDSRVVRRDQPPQARAPSLRHLAVLLARPAQTRAAALATLSGQLRAEHLLLIAGEFQSRTPDRTEVVTGEHQRFHRSPRVYDLDADFRVVRERDCLLKRSLHRASAAERPATVANTREEAQLNRVRDVQAVGIRATAVRMREQLERRLAKAILKVLAAQSMAVHSQQQISSRADNGRDLLGRIERAAASRELRSVARCSFVAATSGRHRGMSLEIAFTPPSQFLPGDWRHIAARARDNAR